MDTRRFYAKWLRDLESEQSLEHGVPNIIPKAMEMGDGSAAWGDAAVIIPWTLYCFFGDKNALANSFESMKTWIDYIGTKTNEKGLWMTGFQYGDWLALDGEGGGAKGATDDYFVANAYYAYSTSIVAKAASILGLSRDAAQYGKLHAEIVDAFQQEYVTPNGRLVSETQTACVLALAFNLIPQKDRKCVTEMLAANIGLHNGHLTTGFTGTPYLCHVLSENGFHELAGKVFLEETYPGWLHCVNLGATTIWERWNSMLDDGSFNPDGMNSFNHYAYGSIGSWMYQKLGGLNILEPGWEKSRIAPMPISGITWVDCSEETPFGKLSCKWQWKPGEFTVDITVPTRTSAEVILPGKDNAFTLEAGTYHYQYETEMNLSAIHYTENMLVKDFLTHPVAKGMLSKYLPEMLDNGQLQAIMEQPLSVLMGFLPEDVKKIILMVLEEMNKAEDSR
jgi:alpha-L-rhamnosidase